MRGIGENALMSLTDVKIRNAKARAKSYKLSDSEGLYLLIKPTEAKLWQMKYRFDGKEKTLSIGQYPTVSIIKAREKRFEAKKMLNDRIDPSAKKQEDKRLAVFSARNTFKAIAQDWYDSQKSKWTNKHGERLWRRLELYAFAELGNRPISSIKTPDLIELLRKLEKKDKLETVYRLAQTFNVVFRYAVHCGLSEYNPASDLQGVLKPYKTVNFPTIGSKELPKFFEKFENVETTKQNKIAIMLLMLTFLRPGELRQSKWSDIDLGEKQWVIPAERMKMRKPHVVPLCEQAIALLEQLKQMTGNSEYLFPSQQQRKHPYMSEGTINKILNRMGYQKQLVGHGFRSLASTTLNEQSDFHKDIIEAQLSHRDEDKIRATYNRAQYFEERVKMMQWWGDYLFKAGMKNVVI
jgi:integrase